MAYASNQNYRCLAYRFCKKETYIYASSQYELVILCAVKEFADLKLKLKQEISLHDLLLTNY